jgi:hypothetical protein
MGRSVEIEMGEAKLKRSATQRFIARYPDCCFCGGLRRAVTREHMPPKALFDGSHRPDKLVMPACHACNRGTSTADLIASIISRWGTDVSPEGRVDHRRLAAQVRMHHPELVAEWTSQSPSERLEARFHLEKHGVSVPASAGLAAIGPLTIRQLNLFSHKVVLGLYFQHFQKPLPNTGRVCAYWRSKEDFAKGGIPPVLLEIMKRYGTLEQGRWNAREIFEYRFEPNEKDGLFACLARLRGGVYVAGFAAENAAILASEVDSDWIVPSELLDMMSNPLFEVKR